MRGDQALSRRLKKQRETGPSASPAAIPAPAPQASRAGLVAVVVLAACGLAVAIYLAWVHRAVFTGQASGCSFSETFSCDKVAASPYAMALGVPVAAWGAIAYALIGALAISGLRAGKPHPGWPVGFLLALAAVAVAASAVLAYLSHVVIGAWCPYCMGSWAVSLALLGVTGWMAWRIGVGAALRSDVAAAAARPGRTAVALAALLAVVAAAEVGYRWAPYWQRGAPVARAVSPGRPDIPMRPIVVVEYSDYECPFCARAHDENKAIFGGRRDVVLERRQFPLDPTCNPAVHHAIHLSSCALARAALCAGEQGKFEEMDDALFRNQREHKSIEQLAQEVGLDLGALGTCLDAPRTQERLLEDIRGGMRDEVHATPTYVVNGTNYGNQLPPGVLPPRP